MGTQGADLAGQELGSLQVRLRQGQLEELALLRQFLPNVGSNQEAARTAMDAYIARLWREVDVKRAVLGGDDDESPE